MALKAQLSMVINLDKCIGCHTCSITCKNTWTNREGTEYMWWNNVETKPGIGYPKRWEDQNKYRGGWKLENGQLKLKLGGKLFEYINIFHNPYLPTIDDYYEPWDYDYENLFKAKESKFQPVARPKSAITGEYMDKIQWGPNWEDDLAGSPEYMLKDPNIDSELEKEITLEFEKTFFYYLPRLCNHCLNAACMAACPSGAIYKREEDGIVLVDQEVCRGWRFCISSCPYKKVYFNWHTQKAEKCIFCYPRIEAGLPTVCSETCVGRIRYIGVIFYDIDKVKEAASEPDEAKLVEAQLKLFYDPNDEATVKEAEQAGIRYDWIEAAKRSPTYKLIKEFGVALPLHPEYRTLPMVWYVPPLSPILQTMTKHGYSEYEIFPAIDEMRIPIKYLAKMFAGGNEQLVRNILKKLLVMRMYMRAKQLGREDKFNQNLLKEVGLTPQMVEEMYRLLAVAKYNERFVIPTTTKEKYENVYREQGLTGYDYIPPCDFCNPQQG
jgi:nitrate reductase beta subunit